MNIASRMGILDMLQTTTDNTPKSEYVIVDLPATHSYDGYIDRGLFRHKVGSFYVCKRTVANNLNLQIISDSEELFMK